MSCTEGQLVLTEALLLQTHATLPEIISLVDVNRSGRLETTADKNDVTCTLWVFGTRAQSANQKRFTHQPEFRYTVAPLAGPRFHLSGGIAQHLLRVCATTEKMQTSGTKMSV